MNPVLAVLLGVWLGGEQVARMSLVAMPVILAGVVLVILGQRGRWRSENEGIRVTGEDAGKPAPCHPEPTERWFMTGQASIMG